MARTKEWDKFYKRPEYASYARKSKDSYIPEPKKIAINRCLNCGVNLKVFPCLDCKINGH